MEIPKTIFTKEKANYWRWMSLIYDIGGDVLREMLKDYYQTSGSTLTLFLGTRYTKYKIQCLLNKNIITQDQYNLMYPANNVPPDLKSFDISLLFTLLRNLHPKIKTGEQVWTARVDTDLSREADIVRITDFRNKVAHSHTASMSDADFTTSWTDLETVLLRLVKTRQCETNIKQRIEALKTYEPALDIMADCEELIRNAVKQESMRSSDGLTIAHWVAFSGRVKLMKILVKEKEEYGVAVEKVTHDGKNVMHIACEGGHYDMFFYLFQQFPGMLHKEDNNGRLPWHWAAYGGNLEIIDFFCKLQGAFSINLLGTDFSGRSMIFYAALGGKVEVFSFIKGKFPQLLAGTGDFGFTCGHYAAYGGKVEIINALLEDTKENVFDLRAKSDSGMSLLHSACLGGSFPVVEFLSHRVDASDFDETDDEGKGAVHWAATGGSVDIMKYLRNNGRLTILTGSGKTILHEACAAGKEEMFDYILDAHPEMLNAKDDVGNTAAHLAAYGGNVNLMTKMRDLHDSKKTDLTINTDLGETILHKACASGQISIFEFILKLPLGFHQEQDDQGFTIMHWAALGGSLEIIKTILDSAENEEQVVKNLTNDGQNVLHLASSAGKKQMFEYLLSKYPKLLTGRDECDNTVAHSAARGGNHKLLQRIIKLFNEKNIDLYSVNENGQTVMHVACMAGWKFCVNVLLETVPDMINKIDRDGCSIFHWAAYSGNIELLKMLRIKSEQSESFMVNIQDKTHAGRNVLHFACSSGRLQMFLYLACHYNDMLVVSDDEGFTMAHWAALGGSVPILRVLEELKDVDFFQKSEKGLSIIHSACLDSIYSLDLEPCKQRKSTRTHATLDSVKMLEEQKNYMIRNAENETPVNKRRQPVLETVIEKDSSRCAHKRQKKLMFEFIVLRYEKLLFERDVRGRNVYHLAAKAGNKFILEYLDDRMPEKRLIEDTLNGETVLHFACLGDRSTFQYVWKSYQHLQRQYDNDNWSVIHWAAYGGNVKIMEDLFNAFPDEAFRETADKNRTIIDLSCESGKMAMFGLLVRRFPDLLHIEDDYGKGPAFSAAYGGSVTIMKYLKARHDRGAINILQAARNGSRVLHWACLGGGFRVVQFITKHFPDLLTATNNANETVMHFAVYGGNTDVMKYLVQLNQERELKIFQVKRDDGQPILHSACERGHKGIFELLIDTYPDLINVEGNAAHWAAHGGNVQIMESLYMLHRKGIIDILKRNERRQSILDVACSMGKLSMFKYLLHIFPELVEDNKKIHTAMIWAASGGNAQIMESLIESKEKLSGTIIYDRDFMSVGRSCLFLASMNAHYDMFCIFLENFPFPDILCRRYILPYFLEILRNKYGNEFENILPEISEFYCFPHYIAHGGCLRILKKLENKLNEIHSSSLVKDAIAADIPYYPKVCLQHLLLGGVLGCVGETLTKPDSREKSSQVVFEISTDIVPCNDSRAGVYEPSDKANLIEYFCKPVPFVQDNMLQIASERGHLKMVDYLLQQFPCMLKGQNILQMHIGHSAAGGESKRVMKQLIELHSGGRIDLTKLDLFGLTIIHHACKEGNTAIFMYICKEFPELITLKDKYGNTAAHWAAFSGNIGIIKYLTGNFYESGEVTCRRTSVPCSDIFSKTYDGKNILHCAVLGKQNVFFHFVAKRFPQMLNGCDNKGKSVAQYAARLGNLELMEFLLDGKYASRLDPRQETNGMTILHIAVFNQQQKVFDYILRKFPEMLTNFDDDGKTVVHYLAQYGYADKLRSLMEGGHVTSVNLKERTRKGMTILHLACKGGHRNVFDYIIENVPELLNVNDVDGRTVTYWAFLGCNKGIIRKVSKHFQDLAPSLD